ncbi:hypothetical protein RJ641_025671 [Dillenia turbinata]|uniref:Uncharacterized protein n=1 Tax=Dillenia turbinata TaxID=194707 RepID=A0AAN8W7F6_9MAGN
MAAPFKRPRCQEADNKTKTSLAAVGKDKVLRDNNNNFQKQTIDLRQLDEVYKELKLKESV